MTGYAPTPLFIYIAEAQNGMIKFGITASIKDRISSLCSAGPVKVRVISSVRGTRADERQLLASFDDSRGWGEWFYPTSSVMAYVSRMRGIGVDRIVDWDEIKYGNEKLRAAVNDPRVKAKRAAAFKAYIAARKAEATVS